MWMDIRTTITKKGISKEVKRDGSITQGGWKLAKSEAGGGIGQQSDIHESAVRICITAHVCMHLMNIVLRL